MESRWPYSGNFIHDLLGEPLPGVHDGIEISLVVGVFIGCANEVNRVLDVAVTDTAKLAVRARTSLRAGGSV